MSLEPLVTAFVRAWDSGDDAALRALAPLHDAPGDSTSALLRAAGRAGMRPSGVVFLAQSGPRAVARVELTDAAGTPAEGWLLIGVHDGSLAILGGSLHESVAACFLAGFLEAPIAWRALPESIPAQRWAAELADFVRRLAPEVRESMGLRRRGSVIGLHRTLALGSAPRAAALLELRGPEATETAWFLLDLDENGQAEAREAQPDLDVERLCRGVRGARLPILPAPAGDPVQQALAAILGLPPEAPTDEAEANSLAQALFAAFARGNLDALAAAQREGDVIPLPEV